MRYMLGVDGGGTGTRVCVADERGNILHRFSVEALNVNGQTEDAVQNSLNHMVQELHRLGCEPEACIGVGAGVAGISNPGSKEFLRKRFAESGFKTLCLYGDHETALASAFEQGHGIVLISGTGSMCYGRAESGKTARAGGFGHLIDDGGSAYRIAVEILAAIVRADDGRGPGTVLKELVFEKLKISSIGGLLQYIYTPNRSKKEIAAISVLLEQADAVNDEAAYRIRRKCIAELTELVITVGKKLPGERKLAMQGSVLQNNLKVRTGLAEALKAQAEKWETFVNAGYAEDGALRLLCRNYTENTELKRGK